MKLPYSVLGQGVFPKISMLIFSFGSISGYTTRSPQCRNCYIYGAWSDHLNVRHCILRELCNYARYYTSCSRLERRICSRPVEYGSFGAIRQHLRTSFHMLGTCLPSISLPLTSHRSKHELVTSSVCKYYGNSNYGVVHVGKEELAGSKPKSCRDCFA